MLALTGQKVAVMECSIETNSRGGEAAVGSFIILKGNRITS